MDAPSLVGAGVDEHLERDRGSARVARHERHHGGEVAARAVAADGQLFGIYFQTICVAGNKRESGKAILHGRRKRGLGRFPILHREHRAARAVGERAADDIVRVEIADHPAAAVEIDQRGQHFVLGRVLRPVRAHWNRTGRRLARAATAPIRPPADPRQRATRVAV